MKHWEDQARHLNKIPLVLLAYSPKRDHRTLCRGSPNRYTPGVCLPSRSISSERHHTQGLQTKTRKPEPPVSLCRACSHSCSSTHRDAGRLWQASPEHCSLCFIKEKHNINMKKTYTKLVPPRLILYTPSFQNDFLSMQSSSYHFPLQNLFCH